MLVQELKTIVILFTWSMDWKTIPCSRNARAHSPDTWFLCAIQDARCKTEESPYGIKNTGKFSIIIPHLTSTVHRLLSDRLLCWKEPIVASLLCTLEKPRAARLISKRPIREAKSPSSKWLSGHKSNAKSKNIYCSFISIYSKLNLPRETKATPQFASKTSSLVVSNGPRTHSPWHTTVENQLGNPASSLNWASPGTTPSLGMK